MTKEVQARLFVYSVAAIIFGLIWYYVHSTLYKEDLTQYKVHTVCTMSAKDMEDAPITCIGDLHGRVIELTSGWLVIDTGKIFIHPLTKNKYHIVKYNGYVFKGRNGHEDIIQEPNKGYAPKTFLIPFGTLTEEYY